MVNDDGRDFILQRQERLVVDPCAARGVADEQDDEEGDEGEAHEGGESKDDHGMGPELLGVGRGESTSV